jgi:hypothetical protein
MPERRERLLIAGHDEHHDRPAGGLSVYIETS